MSKITKSNMKSLLEAGIITQEQYDEAVAKGLASSGRRASSGKVRVCPGTRVVPQMYFKNGKGVEDTEEMKALRQGFKELQEKYTEEVDATSLLEDASAESVNEVPEPDFD